jgi:hypothetical protein
VRPELWAYLKATETVLAAKRAGRKPTDEEWREFDTVLLRLWESLDRDSPST